MKKTRTPEGPAFFKYRWAACATPECVGFGKYKRIPPPTTEHRCRECAQTSMKTSQWKGWPKLRVEAAHRIAKQLGV